MIIQMILQWQILIILNLMLICNPIQDFKGGGSVQVQQTTSCNKWIAYNILSMEWKSRKLLKNSSNTRVVNYVPQYARFGREVESNCVVLDAMKSAYVQITTTRHSQNLTFKNVLLFVVVSTSVDTNQMHIAKTVGAF